jgi:hypothetical protein
MAARGRDPSAGQTSATARETTAASKVISPSRRGACCATVASALPRRDRISAVPAREIISWRYHLASTTVRAGHQPCRVSASVPVVVPEPLLPWLAAATAPAGSELRQGAAAAYRSGRHDHYAFYPDVRKMTLNTPGQWKLLDAQDGAAAEVCATGGSLTMICRIEGYCSRSSRARGQVPSWASGWCRSAARWSPEPFLMYGLGQWGAVSPAVPFKVRCGL